MAYKIAVQELNQWLFADQYFDIADVSIELMEEPLDLVEINIESHPLNSLWESELSVAKAESKVYSSIISTFNFDALDSPLALEKINGS